VYVAINLDQGRTVHVKHDHYSQNKGKHKT